MILVLLILFSLVHLSASGDFSARLKISIFVKLCYFINSLAHTQEATLSSGRLETLESHSSKAELYKNLVSSPFPLYENYLMKVLHSIRNKYAVSKTNGILSTMCFTISLCGIYIRRYLKETMKISLKKLSASYYRVYFNGKICDKNPCDPFLW